MRQLAWDGMHHVVEYDHMTLYPMLKTWPLSFSLAAQDNDDKQFNNLCRLPLFT